MLSYTGENALFIPYITLALSIPEILFNLVAVIFLLYISLCLAVQVIEGLKNKSFELTNDWKYDFRKEPIRYVFFIVFYSFFFVLVAYMGCALIYGLFIRSI